MVDEFGAPENGETEAIASAVRRRESVWLGASSDEIASLV